MIVLPFAWRPMMQQIHLIRRHFWIMLLLAFLLFVGGNAVLFLSLQYTIAINVGVLNSFEPLIIIIAAWAIFRDRVTFNQVAGVHGLPARRLRADRARRSPGDPRARFQRSAISWCSVAYVSWALYAVYLRLAPRALDQRVMLFLLLFLGALLLIPFYLIEWAVDRPMTFGLPSIAAIVGLAAVLLGHRRLPVELFAIRHLGPSLAGIFIHLIVAFTVVMAIVFLGEVFAWFHARGRGADRSRNLPVDLSRPRQ